MSDYQLRGTPSLIVFDKTGAIRLHHFGRADDLALGVLIGQLLSEYTTAGTTTAATETSPGGTSGTCNDESCER